VFAAMRKYLPDLKRELLQCTQGAARPGDLSKSCLNCAKAENQLGFRPEYSLAHGLEKTVTWRIAKK
jgi:nucleoside-diphosphate-sugar epimerase